MISTDHALFVNKLETEEDPMSSKDEIDEEEKQDRTQGDFLG